MKSYRPEIDGLRALAVLVVLFFHAKLGFPGGFVGVDVFFVISGFLITSIILKSINKSEFSSLEFWERRVRRIAPALIVTLAATMIAGWFFYFPDDFKQVGTAAIAQSAFVSNVFHMKVSGYFAPSAETMPLLHTWSLAVEEQFYILFPLALLIFAKKRREWIPSFILIAFIGSLALSVVLTPIKPQSSFYLPPTRAWELLIGSLLAAYPAIAASAPKWVREVACWGGLLAIGLAVWLFDSATPIPGTAALLPCVGAAAFIWANRNELTSAGKLFAWKPLVFVGQVSYSLYLIHWPLLVFSFYVFGAQLAWPFRLGLLGIAFILAVLSWALVETPFREKRVFASRKAIFAGAAMGTVGLLLFGVVIKSARGIPSRFDPQVVKYANARNEGVSLPAVSLKKVRESALVNLGRETGQIEYMLWGDSHAMALMPAIEAQCKKNNVRGSLVAYPATPPVLDFISRLPFSMANDSPEYNKRILDFAISKRVRTVVLAGLWANYAEDPAFKPSLEKTVRTLRAAGIKVVIVLDVASMADDVPRRLAMASLLGKDVSKIGIPVKEYRDHNGVAEHIIRGLASTGVTVLDPAPYFVDQSGLWRMEFGGESMYMDSGHLSIKGALRLMPLFDGIFKADLPAIQSAPGLAKSPT